LLWSLK